MIALPGYDANTKLFESIRSLVYRGRRVADQEPVILKVMKKAYPTPAELARFRLEYEIAKNLNLKGVATPYNLEPYKNGLTIVMEDFGGESLTSVARSGSFVLTEWLSLFIQIADILGQIHHQHIIHKDINPSNIVVTPPSNNTNNANANAGTNRRGWQVKLIDFGISTVLSRENATVRNPNVLEGTLTYMSPEQTGRMNRAIDYRTDFYSLGVTFYELLTGRPPFNAADALEMVHAHIARRPQPPHRINQEVPETVSKIVLKLLAKTAEERYQSAYGLKADLAACLDQMQATGYIAPLPLGQQDISDQFQISQKLYGRQAEIDTLLTTFEQIPPSQMILVSGYAGIGKSSLIYEIHKPIVQRRGYFISGKFDQYKRDIPYASLIQAFQELIRHILTEDEAQVTTWKESLLAAFGSNGQVIIDVIPEIELIVGPQAPVPTLPPTEAQNRFNLLFQKFVRVFAQEPHPLVIFLDDLQWADSVTLSLLKLLLTDPDTQHLLVIGAYRDNEVEAGHPLRLALAEMKKTAVIVKEMALEPLQVSHVTDLIADTLNQSPQSVAPLAKLVVDKTGGNPFFVNEFLKSLYDEGALSFVAPVETAKTKERGGWQWDVAHIQGMNLTDNVVELMAGKIQKLAVATQQALKLAACIGNHFDLETLAIVGEKSQTEMSQDLWEALEEGLVVPIGDGYKLVQEEREVVPPEITGRGQVDFDRASYEFLHDRVQQAAYSLIPMAEKQALHLKIGRLMLDNVPSADETDHLFDVVSHLNMGADLITAPAEREQLARLNLTVGQKAKSAMAYEPALHYLADGIELLPPDRWQRHYELTFALYRERADAEYLAHNFEQADALFDVLLAEAQSDLDRARIYTMRAVQYANLGQFDKVLQAGRTGLSLLRTVLPDTDEATQQAVGETLAAIQTHLGDRQIAELRHLPTMTDPLDQATIRLFNAMLAPSYLLGQMNLTFLLAAKMVNMSIEHGNADVSAPGYIWYGLFVGAGLGNLKVGYEYGQLALSLEESPARHQVTYLFASSVNHFREHGRLGVDFYQRAYQMCIEAGDLVYAGYASNCIPITMFMAGWPLEAVDDTIQQYKNTLKVTKNPYAYLWPIYEQMGRNLRGLTPERMSLSEGDFDEAACLKQLSQLAADGTDIISLNWLGMLKTMQLYIFEAYDEALTYAKITNDTIAASTGLYLTPCYNFYYALLLTALYPTATADDQQKYWETLERHQEGLKNWVENSPANFEHQYLLVEAEMARLRDDPLSAMTLYDQAIESAQANDYLQNEGIANELAAKFYLERGHEKIARPYLLEARYAYLKWGALGKVAALDEQYRRLLGQSSARLTGDRSITATGDTQVSQLDLSSVLKASQAISEEIVLDKLLANLMEIVIENAGAQQGYLLLKQAGRWVIEAEGVVDQATVTTLQSLPVEAGQVAPAIVNYVARTHEAVVLDDAVNLGDFTGDAYIVTHRPKSVLCLPLLNQGQLGGILYLENNLTTGAFTADRLQLLNVLSAQAAISIENAALYADLEHSERKYRTLFEDSKDVILITRPAGEIVDISPACLDVFGYPRDEMLRLNIGTLYATPADRQAFRRQIERDGAVKDFEVTYRRKDGALIDCLITATLRQADDGSLLGYQGIIRDITERKQAEQERQRLTAIERELSLAQEIQRSLLPPVKPGWSELEVWCYSMPAREVGGDFYAYHVLEGYDLTGGEPVTAYTLAVGDVSGKGMPAALLMTVSLASLQAVINQPRRPAELLTYLDQAITPYTRTTHQNCALVYMQLTPAPDGQGRILHAANAGCITPIIRRARGGVEWVEVGGLPLGVDLRLEFGYDEVSLALNKGDIVILTSDGVVEANGADNEIFGFDRLEQVVAAGPTDSAAAMLTHLKNEVTAFVGQRDPHDDLTIIVVRV